MISSNPVSAEFTEGKINKAIKCLKMRKASDFAAMYNELCVVAKKLLNDILQLGR